MQFSNQFLLQWHRGHVPDTVIGVNDWKSIEVTLPTSFSNVMYCFTGITNAAGVVVSTYNKTQSSIIVGILNAQNVYKTVTRLEIIAVGH